ncbi:hypothetical protein L211DRAFT_843650 [Terfezia boudieri ATCC MYA-4762]|uniref:Uncharacterized protein n=1 Tax=Terfezia boudieri ATCC MYA-4762 TaxID=1051890 RepID=A0A3N4L9K8_9PEZI|nr:hypothetical protein L211DRAFT_843650 [Terfezia boudieri ATCC MYA-4762]
MGLSRRQRHGTFSIDAGGMVLSQRRKHGTVSMPEAWHCLEAGGMALWTVLTN